MLSGRENTSISLLFHSQNNLQVLSTLISPIERRALSVGLRAESLRLQLAWKFNQLPRNFDWHEHGIDRTQPAIGGREANLSLGF